MFTFLATDNIGWINEFAEDLRDFALPFLIVLTAVAGIYAIVLGVKIGISDGTDQRSKAINNMVNLIISFVVVVVLCVIFFSVASYMGTGKVTDWLTQNPIFGSNETSNPDEDAGNTGSGDSYEEFFDTTVVFTIEDIDSIVDDGFTALVDALQDIDYYAERDSLPEQEVIITEDMYNNMQNGDYTEINRIFKNYVFIEGTNWGKWIFEGTGVEGFNLIVNSYDIYSQNNINFIKINAIFYVKNSTRYSAKCNILLSYEKK